MKFGYACHPLAYKDALVYMVGGKGSAAMAFRQTVPEASRSGDYRPGLGALFWARPNGNRASCSRAGGDGGPAGGLDCSRWGAAAGFPLRQSGSLAAAQPVLGRDRRGPRQPLVQRSGTA